MQIRKLDWALLAVVAAVCFVLFNQTDLIVTANNSFILLKGHVLDFYSASTEYYGVPSANYLLPTYVVFALWNLPIYLLGKMPVAAILASSFIKTAWYKLLPVLVYLVCGFLIKRICQESLGLSEKKSVFAKYLFYSAPLAIFSQFIFGGYDVFMLLFILLGLRQYLKVEQTKKSSRLFILYFAIAISFKYFALLIFLVLLLLREKQVHRILVSLLAVAVPALLVSVPYLIFDAQAFAAQVVHFKVLGYATNQQGISLGMANISPFVLGVSVILFYACFVKPDSRESLISYAFFLCCAICFALFALMSWHPQWLILSVPFFAISLLFNKRPIVLLWLDVALMLPFYVLVVNIFINNVDQQMLTNMSLQSLIGSANPQWPVTMADMIVLGGISLPFTVYFVLFMLMLALRHPRFYSYLDERAKEQLNAHGITFAMRSRLVFGALAFALPALWCLFSLIGKI